MTDVLSLFSVGENGLYNSMAEMTNQMMVSVASSYNGGGFPGLPFFNDTMCGDYAAMTTHFPDNMDLCVWRGWLFVSR